MLLEFYHLCPWSHLVAILAKDSETSRLTNKGTAEPRQVLGVSLTLSSTPPQPNQQGQQQLRCCSKQLLVQLFCWLLPALLCRSRVPTAAKEGENIENIADGVEVDQEL